MTSMKDVAKEIDPIKGQKWVYNLLGYMYQNGKLDPEIQKIVDDWELEDNLGGNDKKWQAANKELFSRYKSGMLPRGRIFSVFYPDLLEEAISIFKAIYHAPSYADFLGIVYWAHTRLNEYQFSYALYVALIHGPNIQWIPTPQPFQVSPELFFNTDVMQQVYDYKMGLIHGADKSQNDNEKIVEGNYTNWYIKDTLDNEHDLTYFMEDIGLSTWYCYYHLRYPFWMSGEEYRSLPCSERGEIYYFMIKTLLNRYRLERLSHDLDEEDFLDWDNGATVGYSPQMTYRNGMHFPCRPERARIPVWKTEELQQLREFEHRISQVVDSGYMMTKDGKLENIRTNAGFNSLGSLVQGNKDSPNKNYYGSIDALSRRIIGFSPKPRNRYQILPSAVENFATSWRDPGFYCMLKRINSYFLRYKKHLGPYTTEELSFEGVRIESVNIVEKHVTTYFEQVDTLIEKLTYTDRKNVTQTSEIKVRQKRLNHRPFTYKLEVNSAKDVQCSIRIFVGPKYNVHGQEIGENYENFFQIDYFLRDLKKGSNTILRHSKDHAWDSPADHISNEKFEKPFEGMELLSFYKRRFGFPARLIIPRGKSGGMPVQIYFYICEFREDMNQKSEPFLNEYDNKPLGFPLDRPIFDFSLPNMRFLDILIYHENESHVKPDKQKI